MMNHAIDYGGGDYRITQVIAQLLDNSHRGVISNSGRQELFQVLLTVSQGGATAAGRQQKKRNRQEIEGKGGKSGRALHAKEVGVRNPMGKRTAALPLLFYFDRDGFSNAQIYFFLAPTG